jgi:hypothetical protein
MNIIQSEVYFQQLQEAAVDVDYANDSKANWDCFTTQSMQEL